MKMMSPRRLAVALVAPALAAGMLAAAPSAQAAGPNSYAYSGARWLSDQPTDGVVHNEKYDFDDYGLSLDVFFALNSLDTRGADQTKILQALEANPGAYIGTGLNTSAGGTGKLATAVQAANGDPTAFGGVDLIGRIEPLVDADGRAKDAFDPDDEFGGDFSNTITQSWVVRALAGADSDLTGETVDFLLKQQCSDGGFRSAMEATPCTTDATTIDATAFAIQALEAADAGQAQVDKATQWMLKQQAADGSFINDDGANTNSTGLAAATLKLTGQTGAAGSAAAWIIGHQVTDAVAEDTALSNELGAIAFDKAALAAGKTEGITLDTRDQWIRATTQAVVGVNAVLPATKLTVNPGATFVEKGKKVSVSITGLAPGEKFTVKVSGGSAAGTAPATGAAKATLTLANSGGKVITVTGSRSSRTGTATVTVLKPATFKPTVAHAKISRNKTQTVRVSGLVAAEPVLVRYAGKTLVTTKASSKGTYSYSFKVGSAKGTKTVRVTGAFTKRTGTKSFVVK